MVVVMFRPKTYKYPLEEDLCMTVLKNIQNLKLRFVDFFSRIGVIAFNFIDHIWNLKWDAP